MQTLHVAASTSPCITQHAYERARQRFSLRADALDRLALRALDSGLSRQDVKGYLYKYFDKLWLEYHKAGNIRLHGDMLFLFNGYTLITLWQLPQDLRALARSIRHKKQKVACN